MSVKELAQAIVDDKKRLLRVHDYRVRRELESEIQAFEEELLQAVLAA